MKKTPLDFSAAGPRGAFDSFPGHPCALMRCAVERNAAEVDVTDKPQESASGGHTCPVLWVLDEEVC